MTFNSQICTSREQSERLLSLGLKKETADCHWRLQPYYNDEGFDCGLEWSCNMGTFLQGDAYELFFDYIPAWSLHRLVSTLVNNGLIITFIDNIVIIEQYKVFQKSYEFWDDVYDNLVDGIEWLIKEGYFPKEYLV